MKTDGRWLFIHQEDDDENLLMLSRSQYDKTFFVSDALVKKLECLSLTSLFKCLRVKPEAYLRGEHLIFDLLSNL
jgi:hypothetical protein